MHRTALVIFLFGCSGEPEGKILTWGDVARDLSTVYCDTVQHCSSVDTQSCVDHNIFHLCELEGTCAQQVGEELQDVAGRCILDIPEYNCTALTWGILPSSCYSLFD